MPHKTSRFTPVSTRSRPKAAGPPFALPYPQIGSFNTQPPEGGWLLRKPPKIFIRGFNTQPPEGGWQWQRFRGQSFGCFNTQPPEGGWLSNAIDTPV